ncbi:MAG: hypothetical protein HY288_04415 [Planctomycetia bacterium]|nr:hypothetical protein [Planctomycetia bacterium]
MIITFVKCRDRRGQFVSLSKPHKPLGLSSAALPTTVLSLVWLFIASSARAVDLPPPPVAVTLPNPDANAFGVSVVFGPNDGLMYVWDGSSVLKQNGIDSSSFSPLGQFNGGGANSADAGPIVFSNLGTQLLFGNGAGGLLGNTFNGQIFSMPASGANFSNSVGKVDFHSAFLVDPTGGSNSKYFVNSGVDANGSASLVSIFDSTTGANVSVIQGILGASGNGMAMDAAGNLYVGIGFGPPHTGELRSFSLADLTTAYTTGTPLDWTMGHVFNQLENNSAAGLFFDTRGFLFAGGLDGVTVFDKQGHSRLYDNHGFTEVTYDPKDDRVLVTGFGSESGIYLASAFLVPEPSTAALALPSGLLLIPLCRRLRRNRLHAAPRGRFCETLP